MNRILSNNGKISSKTIMFPTKNSLEYFSSRRGSGVRVRQLGGRLGLPLQLIGQIFLHFNAVARVDVRLV